MPEITKYAATMNSASPKMSKIFSAFALAIQGGEGCLIISGAQPHLVHFQRPFGPVVPRVSHLGHFTAET